MTSISDGCQVINSTSLIIGNKIYTTYVLCLLQKLLQSVSHRPDLKSGISSRSPPRSIHCLWTTKASYFSKFGCWKKKFRYKNLIARSSLILMKNFRRSLMIYQKQITQIPPTYSIVIIIFYHLFFSIFDNGNNNFKSQSHTVTNLTKN